MDVTENAKRTTALRDGAGKVAKSPSRGGSASQQRGKVPAGRKSQTTKITAKGAAKKPQTAKSSPDTAKPSTPKAPPRGREQVIESIIDATLSWWATEGPAALSLRGIAARAGVNYGLVHRHFRTKEAVIRAAMDRIVLRGVQFIEGSEDLVDAMDKVLPPATGAHARLLAWSVLQYYVDDILPSEDRFLRRLTELAANDIDSDLPDAEIQAKMKAGSMLATLYGWKLFGPYLVQGLGLESLSADELNTLVRRNLLKVIES
jgi:AcrR family transcriptional regulator